MRCGLHVDSAGMRMGAERAQVPGHDPRQSGGEPGQGIRGWHGLCCSQVQQRPSLQAPAGNFGGSESFESSQLNVVQSNIRP